MTTDDYPADMSNHVRDPKIFKKMKNITWFSEQGMSKVWV